MVEYTRIPIDQLIKIVNADPSNTDASGELYRRSRTTPPTGIGPNDRTPLSPQTPKPPQNEPWVAELVARRGMGVNPQPPPPTGGDVPISPTMTLGGGSRTTTPGAYGIETGEKLKAIHEREAAEQRAEAERMERITGVSRTGETRTSIPTPMDAPITQTPEKTQIGYLTDWAQAHQAFKKSIETEQLEVGAEKSKRQEQLSKAEVALQEADEKLKTAEVDPDRFYKGAKGIFRGVLGAIAMAFGAYAQGLSGGKIPNTAASIIENAIDRDVAAQKANIDTLLKQRGYAAETRNYVMGRLDTSLQQYKANQLRIGELDIAHKVALTKKPELILATSKTISDLNTMANKSDMAAALAMEATREKVTKTGTSHQVINPAWLAQLKKNSQQEKPQQEKALPNVVADEVRSRMSFITKVNSLVKKWQLDNPSKFLKITKIFSEKDSEFNKDLQDLVNSQVYNFAKSTFTDRVVQQFKERFESGYFIGYEPVMNHLVSLVGEAKDHVGRVVSQYPQATRSLLDKDVKLLEDKHLEQAYRAWGIKKKQREGIGNPPTPWKPGTSNMMGQ